MKLVKPIDPTKRVMNPSTNKPLPEDGTVVEMTAYWRRREEDGDVTIEEFVKPAQPQAKKATEVKD